MRLRRAAGGSPEGAPRGGTVEEKLMFTWICPQCGREVPPSYTECPDCVKTEQASAAGTAGTAPPAAPVFSSGIPGRPAPMASSQPGSAEPVQEPAPSAPQPRASGTHSFLGLGQAPSYPPAAPPVQPTALPPVIAPRRGLPTWLMAIGFALVFGGVVWGIYALVGGGSSSGPKPAAGAASPAVKPGAKLNPYQRYIEVSGVRFMQDAKKKPLVKFVLTNHSGAEISGLAGDVTVWGRTQKAEKSAAGSFQFSTNIGGWESKDLTVPLATKLEMIELPDWQNVSTDVQVTAPTQ